MALSLPDSVSLFTWLLLEERMLQGSPETDTVKKPLLSSLCAADRSVWD